MWNLVQSNKIGIYVIIGFCTIFYLIDNSSYDSQQIHLVKFVAPAADQKVVIHENESDSKDGEMFLEIFEEENPKRNYSGETFYLRHKLPNLTTKPNCHLFRGF